jgi:hypothetical protein
MRYVVANRRWWPRYVDMLIPVIRTIGTKPHRVPTKYEIIEVQM